MKSINQKLANASAELQSVATQAIARLRDERGDVPGWVLITVMTAGLVVAVWSVADGQLKSVLTSALRSVSQP